MTKHNKEGRYIALKYVISFYGFYNDLIDNSCAVSEKRKYEFFLKIRSDYWNKVRK